MFVIGFSNHVNTSIALGIASVLAQVHGLLSDWALFYVTLRALAFCSRALNGYAFLHITHKDRLAYLPIFWYISYPLVVIAYYMSDDIWCVHLLSISASIQVLATVFAESTILGYIKHVPQDLAGMYGVGKALGNLFEPIVYGVFYFYNITSMKYFFLFFLV